MTRSILATLILTVGFLVPAVAPPALAQVQQVPGTVLRETPEEPPAQPLINPFNLFVTTRVRGGLSVGATCINFEDAANGGPNGGDITIDDMPPGAVVARAFLYYSVLSDSFPVPSGSPTLDGAAITPIPLGTVPRSPCFTQANTGTFRADVTSLITGNGTYQLDGFVGTGTGNGEITEGATLFVIYCDPDSPVTDVVLWEGTDTINDVETVFRQDLTGFLADPVGPVTATLGVAAGNGQLIVPPVADGPDPFLFNGVDLDQLFPETLSGSACPGGFYDLSRFDVSPYVNPGDQQAQLEIRQSGDCYTVAAAALAVSTDQTLADNDCEAIGCGGAVIAPLSVASCGGGDADLALSHTFTQCPGGPVETAIQAVDPLVAQNATVVTDLTPATAAPSAAEATLSLDLTGDTDLVACVEVALLDPSGARSVLKAAGDPLASPYDVTALYTGPGLYRLEVRELAGCGQNPNRFATMTGAVLTVTESTGQSLVEYRVEDAAGDPLCDWSGDDICPVSPTDCPGEETLTVLARCRFDTTCGASRTVRAACSNLQADFTADAECGSQEACFTDTTTDPFGQVLYQWEFNGEGGSDQADPCFTFSGAGPWDVTLTVTDDAGCTSMVQEQVIPTGGPAPVEPSALDQRPAAEPLRIRKRLVGYDLAWEDLGPDFDYHVYRGELGSYYSHQELGLCSLGSPAISLAPQPGSYYYIVQGVNCGGERSSLGRGTGLGERPAAAPDCP